MPSNVTDSSEWRLSTATGIKYRFLGLTGDVEDEAASTQWRALIRSVDLYAFLQEVFPPPTQVGNLYIPTPATMPGVPFLKAQKVSFKSQDESLPIDPFGADPGAPEGTYHDLLEVDIQFGTTEKQESTDPRTFLEINGSSTGEFLNTQSDKAKWVPQSNNRVSGDTNPSDSATVADPDSGELRGSITDGEEEDNTSRNVPSFVIVPQTEWTVTWTQVPFVFFRDFLIHRMRLLQGRVNSRTFPLLFNAPPETILFDSFDYSQQYTWKEGSVETPPCKVVMKFKEKRVMWKGILAGHNHFWRPGVGWQKLLVDGTNTTYGSWDMSLLFRQ